MKRIGVAEISVAEIAPVSGEPGLDDLPIRLPRIEWPVSCEDDSHDREGHDERADRNGDGQPPGLRETALELHSPAPAGHEVADLLDRRRPGVELADDLALVDDEDPVGERADLVEVLAHEQDRDAACSGLAEVRVHRLDRADVEPARRLGDDEDERIVVELSPEDELLEVAAGEVAHGRPRPGGLHVVAPDDPDGHVAHAPKGEKRPARERAPPVRLDDDVARDAQARSEPGSEPILGYVRDAREDRLARIAAPQAPAADADAPGCDVAHSRERLGQLALAVARDAGDPDDLAFANGERDVVHRGLATIARDREPVDLERLDVGQRPRVLQRWRDVDLASDHQRSERARRRGRGIDGRDGPACRGARSRGRRPPSPRGACAR